MSESNIKTEIRGNERNVNRLVNETVELFIPTSNYSQSHQGFVSAIKLARPAMDANDGLAAISMATGVIRTLHYIANIRHHARYNGYQSWHTGDIKTNMFSSGKHFHDKWFAPFFEGFQNKDKYSGSAGSMDWDGLGDNKWEDQMTYWAFVKGVLYSPINQQIKATEKITSDQRNDYNVAVRMLSVDACEEWINEYLDALVQSEKALLNIAAARLDSLGRSDLKGLFNDDVNIPKALLELAATSYSDPFNASTMNVLDTFDFDDIITRSNVSTLYDLYNQVFMRPSTSLNNAQKYFGMSTFESKYGTKRHFLNLFRFCQESETANGKVGYDLDIFLTFMDVFYGDNEYNIAENRMAFLNSNIHWSSKTYDKIFDKQFYTKTSVATVKGLCDSTVYPAVSTAIGSRSTSPSISTGANSGIQFINSSNAYLRSTGSIGPVLNTSSEDQVSCIRVDRRAIDWTVDDVGNFLHIFGMYVSGSTTTDGVYPVVIHGIVRHLAGEMVNVVIPSASDSMNTVAERQLFMYQGVNSNTDIWNGYPEIVDITNLSSFYTAGGTDMVNLHPLYSENLGDDVLYILNVFNRDTRRTLFELGNSSSKKEAKASIVSSDNDNDNDNDGDDSS